MNYLPCHVRTASFSRRLIASAALMAATITFAAVPPPEKLLPEDTLAVLTAPDFPKLRELYKTSPQSQFFSDPAMKPFRDKFLTKWQDEFVKPLERELGVRLDDYTSLPQGQVTIAITQNGWQGQNEQSPGLLFLLDARDKSDQLKTNLDALRKKWVDAGRKIRTEKVREVEFSIVPVSSNDFPKTVRQFFNSPPPVQELGKDSPPPKAPTRDELVIGQAQSLLIVANSMSAAEKIAVRLAGGSAPALADAANYQADHQALFRESPIYGWINARAVLDIVNRVAAESADSDSASALGGIKPEQILAATGFRGLKTIAFNVQNSSEGYMFRFFLGVPESSRSGLFKILAGEPKEVTPPPFVPADATKFQRWRIDGQNAWATLEKMLGEISPQVLNGLNFALDTASTAAKEKDPDFDVRKNLIGNLGNDWVNYEKSVRGASQADKAPPSVVLIGSPRAEQLAAALKSVFGFLSAQAGSPTEREFLGRKIFSIPMPALPFGSGSAAKSAPSSLNYTASGGYVAFSTDAGLIEEYLRSSDSQGKTLRETAGFVEAAQKVSGPGTSLLGYDNQLETMRTAFETLKKSPASTGGSAGFNPIPGAGQFSDAQKTLKDWMDFSLLPPFEKVSKYFYFTVYGGSASASGLTLSMFAPVPPGLSGAGAAAPATAPAK